MGSVLDYIECPNCKLEAYLDYYYKTGEEYINCQHCGYHYSATYKTDDNGKYVTRDGSESYTFDNLIMEEKEIKNPYGAYRYSEAGRPGSICGSLATEKDADDFRVEMRLASPEDTIHFAQISRVVEGEVIIEHILKPIEEQNK
jgi:Zn ribbon nucleic-acid-binding protein